MPWPCSSARLLYGESPGREHGDRFTIVGDRELDLGGAVDGDGHELDDHVDLVRQQIRDALIRLLNHELDQAADVLIVVAEGVFFDAPETDGEVLRHVDVHADDLAVVILEVPRRVGRAGADDDAAAVEHLFQQAVVELSAASARCAGSRETCRGRGASRSTRPAETADAGSTSIDPGSNMGNPPSPTSQRVPTVATRSGQLRSHEHGDVPPSPSDTFGNGVNWVASAILRQSVTVAQCNPYNAHVHLARSTDSARAG